MQKVPLHPLEIRSVIHYLTLQKQSAISIHRSLSEAYQKESVPGYDTIRRWRGKFLDGSLSLEDLPREGRPIDLSIREELSEVLDGECKFSQNELAAIIGHSPHTVSRITKEEWGYVKSSLKYVPHKLNEAQMAERVRCSKETVAILDGTTKRGLKTLWTQDESWIPLETPCTFEWRDEDEPRGEVERPTFRNPKRMISLMFNFDKEYSLTVLPKGETFTKQFFLESVVSDWEDVMLESRAVRGLQGCSLHMDNAPAHNCEDELKLLGVRRLTHPPYSPDLAPLDFSIFGALKASCRGLVFESADDIASHIDDFMRGFDFSERQKLLTEWKTRLQRCIDTNGKFSE
jgi:histone-lysine N-methyltransferase SETMAR